MQPFDREAFLAAAKAAAQPQLFGVTLPGIGDCWVRPLTFGDEMASHAAREALQAQGVTLDRPTLAALRLAQNLCGPSGEPVFDPANAEHLRILAALPVDVVADALVKAGQGGGTSGPKG